MNISNKELPTLLRAAYEENGEDIEKAAESLETIDLMLGVQGMKMLVNKRDRTAKSRWTKGRNYRTILENIILRNKQPKI